VREDGAKVFEVLAQPVQDVQHENVVSDVDAEVDEGVNEALYLSIVVVDAEVTLNEAPEGGVDVEGTSFTVAKEVVIQDQPGIVSHVVVLLGDVLQVRGDGALDPRLDDAVHPVPSRNANIHVVHQHMIRERERESVMPEGEQDVVVPLGLVHGGEVQRDRDERTDVLHASVLDVDVGDDGSLVVIVRRSSVTDGARG
jgi:hypothetical protein